MRSACDTSQVKRMTKSHPSSGFRDMLYGVDTRKYPYQTARLRRLQAALVR